MRSRASRSSLSLAALLLAAPGVAAALDPPAQDSVAATCAQVDAALALAGDLAGALALPAAELEPSRRCKEECATVAACEAAGGTCQESLGRLFDAARTSREDEDPLRRAARARLASEIADAAMRFGAARDAAAAGACGRASPPGTIPARVVLFPDARTLRFRPLVVLPGGRRFALVLEGGDADERRALHDSAWPRPLEGGLGIPKDAFAEAVVPYLRREGSSIDAERAETLFERLEEIVRSSPGLPGNAGVQVSLAEPLEGTRLASLRSWFAPLGAADEGSAVATFRTLDARASLRELRERLSDLECPAQPARDFPEKQVPGGRQPSVAAYVEGVYPSIDLAAGDRPTTQPYVLALPRRLDDATPLVVAVDGHGGRAVRTLRYQAEGLTSRGLAVMAVELPAHGLRASPGEEFLDPFDPAPLAANLRQSALDTSAAIRAVRRCGIRLPDGRVYRPREVLFLGYSVGAMVGVLVRSVEPELGTTVLLAGAGDLSGWLTTQIGPRLGAGFVTCLGGTGHGASCIPAGRCLPPGACTMDPFTYFLAESLALPIALATAGTDPLDFARARTGPASKAPLLLLTGGNDVILHALLATRLADAYGMQPTGAPHRRRGPHSRHVQWPELGHELATVPGVLEQAHDFLLSRGRKRPSPAAPPAAQPTATSG